MCIQFTVRYHCHTVLLLLDTKCPESICISILHMHKCRSLNFRLNFALKLSYNKFLAFRGLRLGWRDSAANHKTVLYLRDIIPQFMHEFPSFSFCQTHRNVSSERIKFIIFNVAVIMFKQNFFSSHLQRPVPRKIVSIYLITWIM